MHDRSSWCTLRRVLVVSIALAASATAVAGGRADSLSKLVGQGKHDAAAAKCGKWGFDDASDSRERELCATAIIARAVDRDAVRAAREAWPGTQAAVDALPREAELALERLAVAPTPADYSVFIRRYQGTPAADVAATRLRDDLLASVRDAAGARVVGALYPKHPAVQSLLGRFPEAFVKVSIQGGALYAELDPPIPTAGRTPIARWAALARDGRPLDWGRAVRVHLRELGFADGFANALQLPVEPFFPVCRPGDWGPVLRADVSIDLARAYVEPPSGLPDCHEGRPPGLAVVVDGDLRALSLHDRHVWTVATPSDAGQFEWGVGEQRASVALVGLAGTVSVTTEGLVQRVGNAWMLHANAAGLPTYVDGNPPAGAPLPRAPRGVTGVVAGPRALPAGELRVMSPLMLEVAALDPLRPAIRNGGLPQALAKRNAWSLDAKGAPAGAPDAAPVALSGFDYVGLAALRGDLRATGAPLSPSRALRVAGVGPLTPLVMFEAVAAKVPVHGLRYYDSEGRRRVVVVRRDERLGARPTAFAWSLDGVTVFGWFGRDASQQTWIEAFHFHDDSVWRVLVAFDSDTSTRVE